MGRIYVNRLCRFGLLLCCYFFRSIECLEIKAKHGEPVEFHLPGIKSCGQYSLLSPSLRPVLIVEGSNVTSLIDPYDKRASITKTNKGFKLTLSRATDTDAGEYTVASSSINLSPPCVSEPFYLTVIKTEDEYLEPWSEWSFCISQCSTHRRRSRSRRCSLNGGCNGMGPTYQTETCNKADHCPTWSSWGSWGECSAKCGKGFKIRKRACLSGNSSLVRSSECRGVSTQSYMCLTVCEVVGTWTEWSEWSNCTQPCGSDVMSTGIRTRVRTCSTDGQRLVTQNCTGNRTEEEGCNEECTTLESSAENTTEAVIIGVSEAATGKGINIVSVIAGSACALAVVVVLIIVLVLKKRVHRRRESVPTLRPADTANNRRKKLSKERKSGTSQNISENGSGNVYSEFNSTSCWPSSEFDSTYALDNPGFPRPSLVNVMETIKDEEGDISDGFDSEFDDNPEVTGRPTICERKEIIYEKSRASCQRTNVDEDKVKYSDNRSAQSEEYVVTENECYEPPELWSNEDVRSSFGFDSLSRIAGDINNINITNTPQVVNETESIYYEPPVEEDATADASKRAEMKRQESEMTEESVYENCEVTKGTLASLKQNQYTQDEEVDDYYEIPENRYAISSSASSSKIAITDHNENLDESDVPAFTEVNMRNGSIVTIDARFPHLCKEDLDSEHVYVNGNAKDVKDFYVTPKYTYGVGMQEKDKDNEHIYDIPKFSK